MEDAGREVSQRREKTEEAEERDRRGGGDQEWQGLPQGF